MKKLNLNIEKIEFVKPNKAQRLDLWKKLIPSSLPLEKDFDIDKIKQHFNKEKFFIKISPINPNITSEKNGLGNGVIEGINLL